MIDKIRQLGRDTIIYGFSGAMGSAIGFFLLPIFTRIFVPSDYGVIELLGTISGIVGAFVVMGMDSAQTFYFYESKENKYKKDVIWARMVFNLFWGGIIFLICLGLTSIFNRLLFNNNLPIIYFVIVFATIFFSSFRQNFVDLFRLLFKPWLYFTTSLTNNFVGYGLAVFFVIYLHKHIAGYLSAFLISSIVVTLLSSILLKEWLSGRFSWDLLKKMLRYGIPLFPTGFAIWLINVSDRYFLLHYLNFHEVGVYAVGAKFASVIGLATLTFRLSWAPLSLSVSKESDANRFYQIIGRGYLVLGSMGVIILMGLSSVLLKLLTVPEYYSGFKVVGLLSYGAVFYDFYTISGLGIWLGEKTFYLTVAIITSALINLIFNALLIPIMGMVGAALATCLAHIIGNLIALYLGEKVYPIGFKLKPILIIAGVTLLVISVQIYILKAPLPYLQKYSAMVALCAISSFCLFYWGIGKDNLSRIVQLIKKP